MSNLIIKFNNGDEQSFRIIFDKYLQNMIFYAYKFVKDTKESEDIVLKCFHKLWMEKKEFDSEEGIKFYLARIVCNTCLNHLKHVKLMKKYVLIQPLKDIDDISDKEINNTYENTLILGTLIEIINEMAPKKREIMLLSFVEGMRDRDIMKKLNTTTGNVGTQKMRAIKEIKEKLKGRDLWVLIITII